MASCKAWKEKAAARMLEDNLELDPFDFVSGFEAIKAEYDYCVTRAEKLENKVYILLAACAFVFVLLTTQIEKAGKLGVPQSGSELLGIIIICNLTCCGCYK